MVSERVIGRVAAGRLFVAVGFVSLVFGVLWLRRRAGRSLRCAMWARAVAVAVVGRCRWLARSLLLLSCWVLSCHGVLVAGCGRL